MASSALLRNGNERVVVVVTACVVIDIDIDTTSESESALGTVIITITIIATAEQSIVRRGILSKVHVTTEECRNARQEIERENFKYNSIVLAF
jgi:hypothetical protein